MGILKRLCSYIADESGSMLVCKIIGNSASLVDDQVCMCAYLVVHDQLSAGPVQHSTFSA